MFFYFQHSRIYSVVNLAGVLIAAGRASDPEVDSLYQQALAISSDRTMQRYTVLYRSFLIFIFTDILLKRRHCLLFIRSILLHNFGVHRYSLGDVQVFGEKY